MLQLYCYFLIVLNSTTFLRHFVQDFRKQVFHVLSYFYKGIHLDIHDVYDINDLGNLKS